MVRNHLTVYWLNITSNISTMRRKYIRSWEKMKAFDTTLGTKLFRRQLSLQQFFFVMLCKDCGCFLCSVIRLLIEQHFCRLGGLQPPVELDRLRVGKAVFGLSGSTCGHLHCLGSGML